MINPATIQAASSALSLIVQLTTAARDLSGKVAAGTVTQADVDAARAAATAAGRELDEAIAQRQG